ncbi:deoxyribose-phosphate aldolase [Leptobacterium sp. I13]|uniref:deoxyribose-phosphate aldolase n=1 Tax=Leptobacterium meishanense TaxID=3128904 RepID=UPI0030EC56DD
MNLKSYIEHTNLNATTSNDDIALLCTEAKQYLFHAVCINSCYVSTARSLLSDTYISICSVVGFPLGAMEQKAKIYEAERAIEDGASEIDMVINIGYLKSGNNHAVLQEIAFMKDIIGNYTLKVIIENCYLNDPEKEIACKLAVDGGADFVKTSTGFGTGGATIDDVLLMKKAVNNQAKIKASGGIKTRKDAIRFIEAGASRIGTSSGVAIINEEKI